VQSRSNFAVGADGVCREGVLTKISSSKLCMPW
jgi:hypothetical protein